MTMTLSRPERELSTRSLGLDRGPDFDLAVPRRGSLIVIGRPKITPRTLTRRGTKFPSMRRPPCLVLIDCTNSTSHERRRDRMARQTAGVAWDLQALFFRQCIAGFLGRTEDEVRVSKGHPLCPACHWRSCDF